MSEAHKSSRKWQWCTFVGRRARTVVLVSLMVEAIASSGIAKADTFVLHGGGKIEGSVVEATDNIIIIRRSGGGMQQIVRRMVAEMTTVLEDGRTVTGAFAGWANGIQHLRTEKDLLRIRAGQILDDGDDGTEATDLVGAEIRSTVQSVNQPQNHSYVPPPIFSLKNGASIVGRPIDFRDPLLTIRRASGGQQTLRTSDVMEVVIRDSNRGSIVGEFIDWSEGIFELYIDDRLVRVSRGAIIDEAQSDVDVGGPLEEPPSTIDQKTETVEGASIVGRLEPRTDQLPDQPTSTEDDADVIMVSVSSEPAHEHDEALLFHVKLSRPAPRTIAIIYSALRNTAGQDDFTNGSGVVTIQAGADSAEIMIPLIDDTIREGDESVSLFLSSDPKMVRMTANRIAAVIKDND